MRIRLLVIIAVLFTLGLVTTGSAYAECYTPCVRGQNCVQYCAPVPLGDLLR